MSIKEIDSDINISFVITFVDAQAVKQLIEYLRLCSNLGDFYLDSDIIRFESLNENNAIYNNFMIDKNFLTRYDLNLGEDEDSDVTCVHMRLELDKLRDIIKSAKKKDSMVIYKKSEDEKIYIKVHNSGNNTRNTSWISPVMVTENIEPIGDFDYETDESESPNCTVSMSEFCTCCSDLKSISSPSTITIYKNGMQIKSNEYSSNCGSVTNFGVIDDGNLFLEDKNDFYQSLNKKYKLENLSEIMSVNIKPEITGYLSKLSGIFSDGIIRIFAEKFMPIKLICSIGDFGILKVHLLINSDNNF